MSETTVTEPERQRVGEALRVALDERDEATALADELIRAVRHGLGTREPEWFPDGFPDLTAAVEAVRWMAWKLAGSTGELPSRWES